MWFLLVGTVTSDELFAEAEANNKAVTWILRILCFLLMWYVPAAGACSPPEGGHVRVSRDLPTYTFVGCAYACWLRRLGIRLRGVARSILLPSHPSPDPHTRMITHAHRTTAATPRLPLIRHGTRVLAFVFLFVFRCGVVCFFAPATHFIDMFGGCFGDILEKFICCLACPPVRPNAAHLH